MIIDTSKQRNIKRKPIIYNYFHHSRDGMALKHKPQDLIDIENKLELKMLKIQSFS